MITACHFERCSKVTFVVGLLQFLTSALIIGWVLSVYWGLLVAVKSFDLPYLGNQPSNPSNPNQVIGDAVNILGNIPRSDQEQNPQFNRGTASNNGVNIGGGAYYNPQANQPPGGPGGFG
jgi:hypothetical protein